MKKFQKGDKVKFHNDKKDEFVMVIRSCGDSMSAVDLPDGDWCYVDTEDIELIKEIKNGYSKDECN